MEHHVPIELCVSGLIHIAHAAFADLGGDFVDAEPGSGIQGRGAACILPLAGRGVQCGGEDVPQLLDDNMIASTDVRLVTQVTAHAGARRPTRANHIQP